MLAAIASREALKSFGSRKRDNEEEKESRESTNSSMCTREFDLLLIERLLDDELCEEMLDSSARVGGD